VKIWRRSYDVPPPPGPDGMTESLKTRRAHAPLLRSPASSPPEDGEEETSWWPPTGTPCALIVMYLER
jgi:bisphosphoglycerate-dependent phosphoglycerate mutase